MNATITAVIDAHSIAELSRDYYKIIAREVPSCGRWKKTERMFTPGEWRKWEGLVAEGKAIQCTGGAEGARVVFGKLAPKGRRV